MLGIKTLSLILLLIIRIRFPRGKSIPTIIRQRYGDPTLRLIRRVEKEERKLRKAELDAQFLQDCQDNGLIPHFLFFRTANPRLRRSNSYSACLSRLLGEEISQKKAHIRRLRAKFSTSCAQLDVSVSRFDLIHLVTTISTANWKILAQQQETQRTKLQRLQFEQSKKENDPKKVIFNFSSHELTSTQEKLLARGLNFALPPKKLKEWDYCLPFELLYRSVAKLPVFEGDQQLIKARLKDVCLSSFHHYNSMPPPSSLTNAEKLALNQLSSVPNLVIQKSDKGNSIVLLDKNDYIAKMVQILSDPTKFTKLPMQEGDEIQYLFKQERNLRKFMKTLVKKQVFTQDDYESLAPSGSQLGKLYGLAKVHKPGLPMRPILSTIGTPAYKLAKALVPVLAPITVNDWSIKDSFSFISEICEQSADGITMASFDVKSLFTNIPLDETVEICTENLFSSDQRPPKVTRADFRQLLLWCVKDCLFVFNSECYKQTDGVAMGSPLGPSFANIFLSHYEKIWLSECPLSFKPVFYRRYVDDCFLLFRDRDHVVLFLNYLNSKHACIEFTAEIENDGCLSFLDVLVSKEGDSFVTSVYRKPTYSGLYSNCASFMPVCFQLGLINTLLYRAYRISSSHMAFHNEVVNLISTLQRNGYPLQMVNNCISKFLNKVFAPRPREDTCSRRPVSIVLPYLGLPSIHAKERIEKLFKHYMPQVDCRVVLRCVSRVSHRFSFKDRVPLALRSLVCYNYVCPRCKSRYIGETKRHLFTRVCEHAGISALTGKVLKSPAREAVYNHFLECGVRPNLDQFSVVASASTDFQVRVKESLLISHFRPVLNTNVKSLKLELF